MLTELQKKAAQAIVQIFETGKVLGDYSSVVCVAGDPGGLTYGKAQTTLMSGNLFLLIKDYCQAECTNFGSKLRPYLDRLEDRDKRLNNDMNIRNILRDAGKEAIMQKTQDNFFDRVYWNPAVKQAENIGIKTALGIAVVYDSTVHGSWTLMRDRTIKQFGIPANIGEQRWISNYVDVRRNWLANHQTVPLLGKTVYRMDAFKKIIAAGNWSLQLPFTVRGLTIEEDNLTPVFNTCAQIDEVRLLRLRQPFMRGADIRQVQQALKSKGYNLEIDGVFGPGTESMIKQFQKSQKLVSDGLVGRATRAALGLDID